MIVVVKQPGEAPEIRDVAPGRASLATLVGGAIGVAWTYDGVPGWRHVAYCNSDDSVATKLAFNLRRPSPLGEPIAGTLVFVKRTDADEDTSMTADEAEQLVLTLTGYLEALAQMHFPSA